MSSMKLESSLFHLFIQTFSLPRDVSSKRDCIIKHNVSEVDSVLRSETVQDWPRESILMAGI